MTGAAVTLDRVQVLVVEDSEDQRNLITRYFELAGCAVIAASTAESAMEACEKVLIDLAVIDLILPGMDGWALAQHLQADRPECPIAITSVLDADDYPPSDAALPKPVSRASVRTLLGRHVPRWVAP